VSLRFCMVMACLDGKTAFMVQYHLRTKAKMLPLANIYSQKQNDAANRLKSPRQNTPSDLRSLCSSMICLLCRRYMFRTGGLALKDSLSYPVKIINTPSSPLTFRGFEA
jgi:hypothetical protein